MLSVACVIPLLNHSVFGEEDDQATAFHVGYAESDITPPPGLPMWGYGARHALTSKGAIAPLMARVVVIHAGDNKLAIVGTDLGRGPTPPMMEQIRDALKEHAKDASLNMRLAEVLSWTGKYDDAIQIYRSLLEQKPDDQKLRTKLAETLTWAGRFDEAATEFRRALGETEK